MLMRSKIFGKVLTVHTVLLLTFQVVLKRG